MEGPKRLRIIADLLQDPTISSLQEDIRIELLQRGAVAALEDLAAGTAPKAETGLESGLNNDQPAVELLYQSAVSLSNESARQQAFSALTRLAAEGSQAAVDFFYRLVVEHDLLAARQIVLTSGWQPSRPALRALFDWFSSLSNAINYPPGQLDSITQAYFEEASPALRRRLLVTAPEIGMENWALITKALEESQTLGDSALPLQKLVDEYPSFTPAERQLLLTWLGTLARQGFQAARETICMLFIQHEDQAALKAALAYSYAPQDPEQRALFYFLAEAWESYEALDFNHNLIVNAYERASRGLRRRLLEHSRYTGRVDWVRGIGSPGEVRWIGDLTDADWELSIARLRQAEKYADLWRLAQAAPPVWSAVVLDLLNRRGWAPQAETDQSEFANLVALAKQSLDNPLVVLPKKSLHAPVEALNCLAVHPQGHILAAGSSDQRILLWDLPQGDLRVPPLIGPAPIVRALALSNDSDLLASASSDHRIRVFRLQGGQVIKTFEGHRAMIRSLAVHPDGRFLYSAGFDGSIRFWRFPYGPELKTFTPDGGEIFSMAVSADGQYLLSGGASGKLHIWTLPDGAAARELSGHTDMITHLAISPGGDLAASAGRDGVIRVWNFTSGSLVRTIENPQGPLTALVLHPNEQVLIGGYGDGEIVLWSLSTGRKIDSLSGHIKMITGLALSPAGDDLYSSDAEGMLQAWDLRTFLTIRLPSEISRPGAAAVLQERYHQHDLAKTEKIWLAFSAALARWRQRFDIELGEFNTIPIGEFDIEIS